MRLIVTAASPGIDAQVDPDTMEWQAVKNPALNSHGGAGIRAAQFVADQQCKAVISGDFGPNAFEALNTAEISMYLLGSYRTVEEVIQAFKTGQLDHLSSPMDTGQRHR
jgi:predicted Fe-Mo cluster-binding NifX family protein